AVAMARVSDTAHVGSPGMRPKEIVRRIIADARRNTRQAAVAQQRSENWFCDAGIGTKIGAVIGRVRFGTVTAPRSFAQPPVHRVTTRIGLSHAFPLGIYPGGAHRPPGQRPHHRREWLPFDLGLRTTP